MSQATTVPRPASPQAGPPRPKRQMGARTQALLIILGCFAASAALRAGDFMGEKPAEAPPPGATIVASDEAVAQGDFATGSTPGAPEGGALELKELAEETLTALGRDPLDPGPGLGLEYETAGRDADKGGVSMGASPIDAPSPEAAELIDALRRREAELEAYAQRLDAREKELSAVEQRIEERLRQLEREKEIFSGLLATIEEASKRDVEHLVKMYAGMKAKKAAGIFNTMDPGFAAALLIRMPANKAREVLALMEPAKAYAVTQRMAARNVQFGDPPIDDAPAPGAAPQ